MDLTPEERQKLLKEAEEIRGRFPRLVGDSSEVKRQRLKLKNRYAELDRLLGISQAKAEFMANSSAAVEPPKEEANGAEPIVVESGVTEERIKCPFCGEKILPDAKKCRFCQEWIRPSAAQAPDKGIVDSNANTAYKRLGVFYWLLMFFVPPVTIVWSLTLPKTHPTRSLGLALSAIWTAIIYIPWLIGILSMSTTLDDTRSIAPRTNQGRGTPQSRTQRAIGDIQNSIEGLRGGGDATLAEFQRIQDGMSYAQVVKIIGAEGTLSSSNTFQGVEGVMPTTKTEMYSWKGSGSLGANMNAMFQNDRLISKAQFGLK